MTTDIPSIHSEQFLIISGGQTGADRAGLDVALALRMKHAGWCPKGRKTEDGPLPPRYRLMETPTADYLVRTERNVVGSEATVVFTLGKLGRGSKRTVDLARKHGRPHLHLALGGLDDGRAAVLLEKFLRSGGFRRLNVAGSRESKEPGIYKRVMAVMELALDALVTQQETGSRTA